ncbi:NUDIX hydrolase [Exiguobacterium sp. UBA4551]|uniref:NUDIX hydrolase n=1 Tax=Exiguobacterium sp. UBA4551 TaxID=1946494 RepID=UPI002580A370|nr:NUDIX domain-containing protein [Exiguobacterium sp. UBA4551]
MISQAIILANGHVLMVRQYVARGEIVWNFPGGQIDPGESPQQACMREVFEETGYTVQPNQILFSNERKYTFLATIVNGHLVVDHSLEENVDILEAAWIPLTRRELFDIYTAPLLDLALYTRTSK